MTPGELFRRTWLLIALSLVGGFYWLNGLPVSRADGVVAPASPIQSTLAAPAAAIVIGDFALTPLADYRIEARVLGRERYRFDAAAAIAPLDFALGWGPMSDSALLRRLSISQGARWYFYRWDGDAPIAQREIALHSANVHLIPANAAIERRLSRIRIGHVVRIDGKLVAVRGRDGMTITSSLRRDDTGAGACEVLLVERIDFW